MSDRPAPAAQGTLSKTPFAHLLLYMREKHLTGTLALQVLQGPAELLGESLLAFQDGQVTQVRLPRSLDSLGEVLVAEGMISMRLLQGTLPRVLAGQGLQGQLLKAMGAMDDAAIERGMRVHVRRKVRRLFALREGDYQYFNKTDLLEGFGRERFAEDVFGVLWEGVRLHANLNVVDTWLGRLASNGVKLKGTKSELEKLYLPPEERAWVELLVSGPVLFESWLERAGDPRSARLLAYVLMITRLVEPATASISRTLAAVAPAAVGPGLGVVRESRQAPSRISGTMGAVRRTGESPAYRRTGENPAAPDPGAVKITNTGSYVPYSGGSSPAIPAVDPEELPVPPAVSDSMLPPPPPVSIPAPAAPRAPAVSRVPDAPRAPAVSQVPRAPQDGAARARLDAATARLLAMQDENYFQMLGVTKESRDDDVRGAFLKAAAQWHPDRAAGAEVELRTAHERIFALLNDAQNTLLDPDLRGRYQSTVADGGGTPNSQRKVAAVLEAATEMQKAEVYFRRRDFAEAERVARQILTVTPDDPNVLTLLAMALLERLPTGPFAEPLKLLEDAVVSAPKNDRSQYQLAMLYKRLNQNEKALERFRATIAANPKHLEAQRELRLLEMRSRGSQANMQAVKAPTGEQPAAGSGNKVSELFSKLFKK